MAPEAHALKAADLLVETLKGVLTLSTFLAAALLGYVGTANRSFSWPSAIALLLLLASGVASVVAINTLINKVNRGEAAPVSARDVKQDTLVTGTLLLLGIVSAIVGIATASNSKSVAVSSNTTITEERIIIGSGAQDKVTIEKTSGGRISRIVIEPRQ